MKHIESLVKKHHFQRFHLINKYIVNKYGLNVCNNDCTFIQTTDYDEASHLQQLKKDGGYEIKEKQGDLEKYNNVTYNKLDREYKHKLTIDIKQLRQVLNQIAAIGMGFINLRFHLCTDSMWYLYHSNYLRGNILVQLNPEKIRYTGIEITKRPIFDTFDKVELNSIFEIQIDIKYLKMFIVGLKQKDILTIEFLSWDDCIKVSCNDRLGIIFPLHP